MSEKKYTAREAGIAILKKTEEMLLRKAEEDRSKMSGKSGMVRLSTQANQNQQGVHQHGYKGSSGGISEAGANLRDANHSGGSAQQKHLANAKHFHQQALAEQKAMPKPNLPADPGMHKEEPVAPHVTKGPIKLAKFMGRMEHKRSIKQPAIPAMDKGEHQPHPGPSRSEHQKVYDAKQQAASEAHLKTPEGEAERQAKNKAMMANMPKK